MKASEFWANFYGNLCIALVASGVLAVTVVALSEKIKNPILATVAVSVWVFLAIFSIFMASFYLKKDARSGIPAKRKR
ncbi:hypothetical protein IR196_04960 [Brucella anthropi]|uniref:hypothetical protein n=1 Tax=Brucella anthropi TaxID=529 RepID=UPI00188AC03F|nr:hypothetical protein [Brucella anthropi]QPA25447.1 hypothetical protein IR196_04960 [Brucella anthropi]